MKKILASLMIVCMIFVQIPVLAFAAETSDSTTITVKDGNTGELLETTLSLSKEEITVKQNPEGYYNTYELFVRAPGVSIELIRIKWSCEETSVIELNDGPTHGSIRFSPVGAGEAYIKAVCNDEVELYCHVIVEPADVVDKTIRLTLYEGCTVPYSNYTKKFTYKEIVTYTSSDEAVATVDNLGQITAVGAGFAKIHLGVVKDIQKADFEITVKKASTFGHTEMYFGEKIIFPQEAFASLPPETVIEYHSIDETVAVVNEQGIINGIGEGEVVIAAEPEGQEAVLLHVIVKKNTVEVKETSFKMFIGEQAQIEAAVSPDNMPFSYSVDKESIAVVDENGLITAVGSGLAKVLVGAKGAEPVEVSVRVIKPKLSTPKIKLTYDGDGVKISWDKVSYADNYEVYRKIGAGKWKLVFTVDGSERGYRDSKIKLNNTYSYKVKATGTSYGLYRESDESNTISKKITKINAPTKLTVTRDGYNAVYLSWNIVFPSTGYEIYRSKSGKTGTFVKVKTEKFSSWTNTGLTTGEKYYYKVRAVCDGKKGAFSEVKSATPNLDKPEINKVTYTTGTTIKVKWYRVANASGYHIYRKKTTDKIWKKVGSVKGNSTFSYKDDPSAGVYLYSVKAYRTVKGKKVFSARTESVRTRTLKAPTITVKPASSGEFKVNVTWSKVTGATGYILYRREYGGSWKTVLTTNSSTRSYTESVDHGVINEWRVRAVYDKDDEGKAYGAFSKVKPIQLVYVPYYETKLSLNSKTNARYITITIKNLGEEIMYIEPEGYLKDASNEKYDRDMLLYNRETGKYVDRKLIRPNKSVTLTYRVSGSTTRYKAESIVSFMFYYDEVCYVGVSSAEYGDYYVQAT